MDNISQVAIERLKIKLTEQNIRDLEAVLSTEAGGRFIFSLLNEWHVFSSSFTGNSETFFKEGERNVGLALMEHINFSQLAKMQELYFKQKELLLAIIDKEMEESEDE